MWVKGSTQIPPANYYEARVLKSKHVRVSVCTFVYV